VEPADGNGDANLALVSQLGGWLFATGGTLALVMVVAPPRPGMNEAGLLAVALVVYGAAATLLIARDRLPLWAHQVGMALGSICITAAIYFSGVTTSAMVVFYFMVTFAAFYFLTWAQAAAQTLVIATLYGVVLLSQHSLSTSIQPWFLTVGMILILGVLIRRVRDRTDHFARAARTDALTGLLNRRGFDEAFRPEIERARRGGRNLSVVVCDLDQFKDVNDRFGHAAGDKVLKRLSTLVSEAKRLIDTAVRVGGEEFVLILPDTDAHGAYVVAERLRNVVKQEFPKEGMTLTISLGLATFPAHAESGDELLLAADQALYAAKALGRNRSVIHSPGLSGMGDKQPVGLSEGEERSRSYSL
ncbi:hypothetical protein LCGC14_2758880, partial [marine sediment metagenome]